MSTAATDEPDDKTPSPEISERIEDAAVSDSSITFELTDDSAVNAPLSWSWRLERATEEECQNFRISPSGYSVHWPDVDEDLSTRGALRGTPAPRPSTTPPAEPPREKVSIEWTPGRCPEQDCSSLLKTPSVQQSIISTS